MIALGCILLFAFIAYYRNEVGITKMDEWALQAFAGAEGEKWNGLWRSISSLGSTLVYAVTGIAVAFLLIFRRHFKAAVGLIISLAVAYGLMNVLKDGFMLARPADAWGISYSGAAFPSGHATMSTALYGIIAYIVIYFLHNKVLVRTLTTILILLIILIGISRMYFQVHYFTDIIAGYILGLFSISLYGIVFLKKKN